MKSLILALGLSALGAAWAHATPVSFDDGWTEQRFSMFASNRYGLNGDALDVSSDGTVSLLWNALPMSVWGNRAASWTWSVDVSVPATDLTLKGGDDRNLSLYFVFLPEDVATRSQGKSIRSLLNNDDVRVLIYVWGGAHRRGEVLDSPYLGPRGRTLVLRPSGTGAESESIDLARDFQRVFGAAATSLVGIAVSADSDDTDSAIEGRISNLRLE